MERRTLSLTTPARRDLHSIRRYSMKSWGRDQTEAYVSLLLSTAELLCDFPERGRLVSSDSTNVHRVMIERHVIYYRVFESEIEIIRILHERMDATSLFG
ncbi:MAG TPA: type II toxin-antitoxin system RelE/ParE family toxin [Thermomicrobiales bacterium]|nr:type II toxin-antitoxin system RelE/ParE family toxin [Thermomicrobiales bacterium]